MAAIKTNCLSKKFDQLVAVDCLTLEVNEGEIFGLVGPDGAGKTTTMRMLTTIMDPTSGDGWIGGKEIVREAESIKEDIGYMSQRFGLYPDLTVLENIEFYADIYGVPRKEQPEKIDELLKFSNLLPFKKRLANNLSGGMKQKLGLACALIHKPKILFLDEPTNGVDPVSRRDFWRILYRLHLEKVTIFLTTAYLDEAERCGRLAFINEGKIMAIGTPEELKAKLEGSMIEVVAENPRKAIAILREAFHEDAVRLFGGRIHVVGVEAGPSIKRIAELLDSQQIAFEPLKAVDPSLEDIFISLLSKESSNA